MSKEQNKTQEHFVGMYRNPVVSKWMRRINNEARRPIFRGSVEISKYERWRVHILSRDELQGAAISTKKQAEYTKDKILNEVPATFHKPAELAIAGLNVITADQGGMRDRLVADIIPTEDLEIARQVAIDTIPWQEGLQPLADEHKFYMGLGFISTKLGEDLVIETFAEHVPDQAFLYEGKIKTT